MNVKRFTARTSRDALILVRQALGEDAVVEVALHRLDPGVTDTDDRFGEVLGGEADGAQHGAGGRVVGLAVIPHAADPGGTVGRLRGHPFR